MKNELKVLVVKSSDGILRPMAGIWKDNESGEFSAKSYMAKDKSTEKDMVVKATLIED